jgi:hypothetical protein
MSSLVLNAGTTSVTETQTSRGKGVVGGWKECGDAGLTESIFDRPDVQSYVHDVHDDKSAPDNPSNSFAFGP